MRISERTIDDVTILDLEGRITVQDGADALHDAMRRLATQNHVRLVLNLEFVPYIDSTTVGELARGYITSARSGGKLKLLKPTTRVRDLLTITRLVDIFEIYKTEDEAVASFGEAAG